MSQSQLPPPFDEVYQKYIAIQNAFKSDLIDAETRQSELEKLEFKDQDEDSWRLSKDGQWYWHNGIEWIRRDPISSPAVPEGTALKTPEPLQAGVKQKRKVPLLWILVPIVVAVLCIVLLAIFYVTGIFNPFSKSINNDSQLTSQEGTSDVNSTPGVQEDSATAQPTTVLLTTTTLSEDQQMILDDFGWPDAFMIMEMDDADGNPQRVETWSYYEYQTSLTFSEGVFLYDEVEAQLSGEIFPTEFYPTDFPLGISMDQLDELLPDVPLVPIENIDYFLEGLDIYLSESFVLGFYENRLFLIDAWAGLPGGAEP
jgi:hypothetical protein